MLIGEGVGMERMAQHEERYAEGIREPSDEYEAHEIRNMSKILPGVRMIHFQDVKLVRKRWGQERWLHEEDAPFGFKVIRIKAGHRTSLQYHAQKRETYHILEGKAVLVLRADKDGPDIRMDFSAGMIAHVEAGAIHRVEAVSDIVLVEASTFDDGTDNVRIEDDYGRGGRGGRLPEEH
jgi:mannose-6-phosphate isomerase